MRQPDLEFDPEPRRAEAELRLTAPVRTRPYALRAPEAVAGFARSAGIFVMSSADSEQFATEFAALGHGVLTYAILSSLAGESSGERRPRTAREVIARAETLVPELSACYRGQPQFPMVFSHGMDFPLVVR